MEAPVIQKVRALLAVGAAKRAQKRFRIVFAEVALPRFDVALAPTLQTASARRFTRSSALVAFPAFTFKRNFSRSSGY